ncbi:hypothetical protein B0T16DRAFT_384405 [Cercophora newfieldiana]|uniref:Uncharacterized protein n=1 Tax=Cercophora newfieldiana TaxID=92897 RepID=A0AA39YN26_9PEZI|nr:hypothetical protein B0T16DRAFT_384405 [Cercophora newfieldiana]
MPLYLVALLIAMAQEQRMDQEVDCNSGKNGGGGGRGSSRKFEYEEKKEENPKPEPWLWNQLKVIVEMQKGWKYWREVMWSLALLAVQIHGSSRSAAVWIQPHWPG